MTDEAVTPLDKLYPVLQLIERTYERIADRLGVVDLRGE